MPLPAVDRQIWRLAFVRFVVTAGFAAVMPFLAMHLAVERMVPLPHIGLLWALSSGVSAAMQGLAGLLADRLGRRRVLLAGMLLRSANLAVLGWAISTRQTFPVIAALAVGNGALRAFYDPIAWALVAEFSRQEERLAAFSVHRIGQSLGWVAGPLLATLAARASYGAMFYVCAPLTLLAPLVAAWLPMGAAPDQAAPAAPRAPASTAPPPRRRQLSAAGDRRFLRFLAGTFVYFLLQTQMYHLLAVYAAAQLQLSRAQVGTLFTVNALLVVALQLPIVRVIARLGSGRALALGSLAYAAGFVVVGAAYGHAALLVAVALLTLCETITSPAQQARLTRLAPPERRASYGGAFGVAQGAAQALGPALGVLLSETAGPRAAWLALAALAPLCAWLYRDQAAR